MTLEPYLSGVAYNYVQVKSKKADNGILLSGQEVILLGTTEHLVT